MLRPALYDVALVILFSQHKQWKNLESASDQLAWFAIALAVNEPIAAITALFCWYPSVVVPRLWKVAFRCVVAHVGCASYVSMALKFICMQLGQTGRLGQAVIQIRRPC